MARAIVAAVLALQLHEAPGSRLRLSAEDSIPNIVWITGAWSRNSSDFTEVAENMNGPFLQDWSERVASNQKLAYLKFGRWVPIGSKIRYLDDEEMKASALNISRMLEQKGVTSKAYEAFTNLRPAAYRADLWRYMILWAYGGVYLDSNLRLTNKLEKWINFKKDQLVLVDDVAAEECAFWNAMMAASPQNEFLEKVIPVMVENIEAHYYGDTALSITGPIALCRALKKAGKRHFTEFRKKARIELRKVNGIEKREFYVVGKDGTTFAYKDEGLHYFEDPRRHYGPMWHKEQVYCDEPGPEEDLGMCENTTLGAAAKSETLDQSP